MHVPPPFSPPASPPIRTDEEIDSTNVRIYFLSRNIPFLVLALTAILVAGTFLARKISNPHPPSARQDPVESLRRELGELKPDLALAIRSLAAAAELPAELEVEIARSRFTPGARSVLTAFLASLRGRKGEPNQPNADLLALAQRKPPEPGANACGAELHLRAGKTHEALACLVREIEVASTPELRAKVIALLSQSADIRPIAAMAAHPDYAPLIPFSLRIKVAFAQEKWSAAVKLYTQRQIERLRPEPLIMTLAASLAWFVIALHAVQPRGWFSFRLLAPPIAVLVGIVVGAIAQFLTLAQENLLGLVPSADFRVNFGIYTGVIAPRDLLLQIIAMLPFMPALLWRRCELDALVVTGCIGLGFAIPGVLEATHILEPGQYLGRLLTDNFLYLSGAALAGLSVYRVLRRQPRSLRLGILTIAFVILFQGIYNTVTRIQGPWMLMIISTIAFLLLSRSFFLSLHTLRDSFTDQCFLGATLVICLGALVATALVAASAEHGFDAAALGLARNSPALLVVGIIFFVQFKRGLAPLGADLIAPRDKNSG